MFLDDILRGKISDKFDSIIEDLESNVSFVNTSGDKWNAVISFDLSDLSPVDKEALSTLLKYL